MEVKVWERNIRFCLTEFRYILIRHCSLIAEKAWCELSFIIWQSGRRHITMNSLRNT